MTLFHLGQTPASLAPFHAPKLPSSSHPPTLCLSVMSLSVSLPLSGCM